jgi:hypothetical protein
MIAAVHRKLQMDDSDPQAKVVWNPWSSHRVPEASEQRTQYLMTECVSKLLCVKTKRYVLDPSVIVRDPSCLVSGTILHCERLRRRGRLFSMIPKNAEKSLLLDCREGTVWAPYQSARLNKSLMLQCRQTRWGNSLLAFDQIQWIDKLRSVSWDRVKRKRT